VLGGKGIVRRATALGALGAALLAAGCGSAQEEQAPAACLASSAAYLRALQAAPDEVHLGGDTLISDCLVPDQEAGQLANVGQQMIITATTLNEQARKDPGGTAALELGFLLGAASKGADPIHTDLIRRLNSAARFSETGGTLSADFERAFGRGYAAGRQSG
jgi:hypothetical protein